MGGAAHLMLESVRFCGGVEPEAVCGVGVGSLPPFVRPPLEMSLSIFFLASVIVFFLPGVFSFWCFWVALGHELALRCFCCVF